MRKCFAGRRGATLRRVIASATVLLSGCTLADQFGSRAVNYNIEAESARDQGLMLNIVRAAYRKPMQFTDVTSAAGTATATGTVGSSLLIGPHQSASGSTLSPGFTFAGGPTFTMTALDTKEFYSGILAPISKSLVSYYVSIGIPKPVLYTLLFAEIDVDSRERETLTNSAVSQSEWNTFQNALNALLDAGLTIQLKDPDNYGPALSAHSLSDPAKLAALAKEKIDLVPEKSGRSAQPAVWHAVKDDPKPDFCFGLKKARFVVLPEETIPIPDGARCGKGKAKSGAQPETQEMKTLLPGVTVRIRSLEGVLYFLGEITRSELGLDQNHPNPVNPWLCFRERDGTCVFDTLFSIHHGYQARSISTTYDSETYTMPVDPSNMDHSAQVLEFAAQLMALSSSSKDLPAPGVVTLIGH